ncbi:hypothetical protein JCM15765_01540 [Paradesulfitobacterium aromaticivorans]
MAYDEFQGLILEQFNRVFGELADINAKVGGLEKRFDGLEEKVDGLEKRFDGLEEKVDGLEKRFDGLEEKVDGLEKRFDGLEEKVDGLESKISRNSLLLERTDKNVMFIQEGIISFRQQVDKKFDDLETGLNDKINVLELVIRNHSAAVDELEGEVEDLHNKSRHMQGMMGIHEVEIKLIKDKLNSK